MNDYTPNDSASDLTGDLLRSITDPLLDPIFWQAERLGEPSAWWRHVPFAHWVIQAASPRSLVELGTHAGVSYSAFCNAIEKTGLSTRCWAVDTWQGDIHSGAYEGDIFENFKNFHDARFAAFSGLLRCTFDEALPRFSDNSLDLLHIDGLHTYEAVRHDFESWRSKLSDRAVVLFHDTNVLESDFGVWRLWAELREQYPSFEFLHGHGLGVLGVGSDLPPAVSELLSSKDQTATARLRSRFAWLGERWLSETREKMLVVEGSLKAATASTYADAARHDVVAAREAVMAARAEADAASSAARAEIAAAQIAARAEADAVSSAARAEIAAAQRDASIAMEAEVLRYAATAAASSIQCAEQVSARQFAERQISLTASMRAQAAYRADCARADAQAAHVQAAANDRACRRAEVALVQAQQEIAFQSERAENAIKQAIEIEAVRAFAIETQAHALRLEGQLEQVMSSTVWQATWPIRRVGRNLPLSMRQTARRAAKLIWWLASLKIKRKLGERQVLPRGSVLKPAVKALMQENSSLIEHDSANGSLEKITVAMPDAATYLVKSAPKAKVSMRLVYVSGEKTTPGHRYRVERPAEAARALGAEVTVIEANMIDDYLESIVSSDALILWRTPWSEGIAAAVGAARAANVKIVFDVDDLMVDPGLARSDIIDGIRTQHLTEGSTAEHFARTRQTMLCADLCIGSTQELAEHMRSGWMPARVLVNGFDYFTLGASRLAARCWAQTRDGLLRIGYAGGSRTHQRDFALCAQAVGDALRAFPQARLVAFRSFSTTILDVEEFPALYGLEDQIEWREFVPLEQLPEEMARFDINLAPLEIGNPFCEAKSELKYFEAALVDVPTIASPTGPYRRAIRDGETGFLADSPEQWRTALMSLLGNMALRTRIAAAARRDVVWTYGPERRVEEISDILDLLRGGRFAARAFEHGILRVTAPAVLQPSSPHVPAHEVILDRDRLGVSAVTIVVPLYNYSEMIIEALDSVMLQTLRPLDLIIVDDASTDESLAVALSWAEANAWRFNHLRVVRNLVNAGLAFTRNVAFDLADTPWVLPLDADNRLRPRCAAECLRVAMATSAAYVYPVIQQFGLKSDLMGFSPYDPVRLSNGNYIDAMALVSRAAWANVGGYDHVAGGWEDFDLWCRFAERGFRGERLSDEPLADYRVHGTSMIRTAAGSAERINSMIADLKKRHPWLTLLWPLPVPRPKAIATPMLHHPREEGHSRLTRLLPILRCPKGGGQLAFSPDGKALISETGFRWPLVAGCPNLFAGLDAPQSHSDSHVSNPLPEKARALTMAATGPVLHLSAGGSADRFPNVIEVEAAIFRHTDVLADAHYLPFADNAFEVVIAMNAFEHYRDPPRAAREILRVLAPGGRVLIRTAFLQPEHEAPWHFFNCTRFGLEAWFEEFETEELHVSDNFHPGHSISWLASECEAALRSDHSSQAADEFAQASLRDFISLWRIPEGEREAYGLQSWSDLATLPQGAQQKIGAGFEFLGRKPS